MSDLRDHLDIGIPLTLGKHLPQDCLAPLSCDTCVGYCHPSQDAHFFPGNGTTPCACGQYANADAFVGSEPL